ncbi:MAG TPA: DNA repair protein RecN [Cyclobacteriaceae bacterium]|jgi:DNA repair protein RecN (Recombination protein N)
MLKELRISNFALIKELRFSPSEALTIITGETGAGKSIMLGAVGLLLGERADTKTLYDAGDKCYVEGDFNISEYDLAGFFKDYDLDYDKICIIRREISPSGKSRAFINDTPVTLDILKELGNNLMDIHSQHDTLLLRSSDFQLEVLDSYAGTSEILANFKSAFAKYRHSEKNLKQLREEHSRLSAEFDYINFQKEELDKTNLVEDEQENLEEQVQVLENSEEIKSNLNLILNSMQDSEISVLNQVKESLRLLKHLTKFSSRYELFSSRLENLSFELEELIRDLATEEENVETDPARAEELKSRLSLIYGLQQKHKVSTIKELVEILEVLEQKVNTASGMESSIKEAEAKVRKFWDEIEKYGRLLSEKRRKVVPELQKELTGYLKDLGMPDAAIVIEITDVEAGNQGMDKVSYLFSANKGIKPKELRQVASGGEFSRLMFCLKFILAQKTRLPTIVFDEIDNGISGETALKLGNMMKAMARGHQVITISHLPQIAARGSNHFFVYKENLDGKAVSKIRELSEEERVAEIAKMIAGDNPTQNAFKSAKELIANKLTGRETGS